MTPKESPPPDGIDFEITDFDTARGALEEPPAGVKALRRSEPDWRERRRAADPRDLQLRAITLDWMRSIDPPLRPRQLLARFPRISNQIAEAWADPRSCLHLLGSLLMDQRGGRRGFPLGIAAELTALQDHLRTRERLLGSRHP